jgi:hypothetical protein
VARRLFALGHNFPEPVLAAFAGVLPMVELVPIRAVDSTWTDLEDWDLQVYTDKIAQKIGSSVAAS